MSVKLVSATPDIETLIMRVARVSSEHPDSDDTRLIGYLIKHKHWSPFDLGAIVLEVETTRDISRQMIRHWSLRPQELSQRYAIAPALDDPVFREARTQDTKKRQRSHELPDTAESKELADSWLAIQKSVWAAARAGYERALSMGIAKEVARAVLPEGMTVTKMYVSGSLRSWIHYVEARTAWDAQKEHREVAEQVKKIVAGLAPCTAAALGWSTREPSQEA